ncbi:hypothetical protein TNCV_5133011 [Trichonephila clavipes]|nr:hypothetical protein TNCV_5133011 [Trichonephila clavipes]
MALSVTTEKTFQRHSKPTGDEKQFVVVVSVSFRKSNRKNNFFFWKGVCRGPSSCKSQKDYKSVCSISTFVAVIQAKNPLMTGPNRNSFRMSRLRLARRSCGSVGPKDPPFSPLQQSKLTSKDAEGTFELPSVHVVPNSLRFCVAVAHYAMSCGRCVSRCNLPSLTPVASFVSIPRWAAPVPSRYTH